MELLSIDLLVMDLLLAGCSPRDFHDSGKWPIKATSGRLPIEVGQRPMKEGKRPIKRHGARLDVNGLLSVLCIALQLEVLTKVLTT